MKLTSLKADSQQTLGNTLVAVLLAVVVLGVVSFVGLAVWRHNRNQKAALVTTAAAVTASSASSNPTAVPISSGTDNSSLQSDLTNINLSLNQSSQNLQAAGSAVNDQALTVPAN